METSAEEIKADKSDADKRNGQDSEGADWHAQGFIRIHGTNSFIAIF